MKISCFGGAHSVSVCFPLNFSSIFFGCLALCGKIFALYPLLYCVSLFSESCPIWMKTAIFKCLQINFVQNKQRMRGCLRQQTALLPLLFMSICNLPYWTRMQSMRCFFLRSSMKHLGAGNWMRRTTIQAKEKLHPPENNVCRRT